MHVGLLNLDPLDDEVRGAAYHLLGQLCVFLNYDKVPITAVQGCFLSSAILLWYLPLLFSWFHPRRGQHIRRVLQQLDGGELASPYP